MMDRFSSVFEALDVANARYVVVGGVAVNLYGHLRGTTDIDLVIDLAPEDARKTLAVLNQLGYRPKIPVNAEDFADPQQREAWIRDKGMLVFPLYNEQTRLVIDVFVSYPLPFDELWERSQIVALKRGHVRIPALQDLLQIKREAGRPKDIEDVRELERVHGLPPSTGDFA